jgi:hypothetical protein
MPLISRFYGINIVMYYMDHSPPHFHVIYNEFEASICIKDLKLLRGKLPRRVISLVLEWANLHRDELLDNWQRAISHDSLLPIKPLT